MKFSLLVFALLLAGRAFALDSFADAVVVDIQDGALSLIELLATLTAAGVAVWAGRHVMLHFIGKLRA